MSGNKRVNILVYSGNGSTVESVRHCLWSLRRLLGPHYAVIPLTTETLLKEPWQSTCALFVMPGGADLGYCRSLNGQGNRLISAYVNKGGKYLGLCAGGYYACKRCEFEVGRTHDGYEVIGDRELGFFPGICRGLAFPGFVYHSERGTRAAEISVNKDALISAGGAVPELLRAYYNGGGVFVDAEKFKDRGVEVLASYTEHLHVNSGKGQAAVVYCKVGDGAAMLTGPHPEFSAVNLNGKGDDCPEYPQIIETLAADESKRVDFMKACLSKLGLQVNKDNQGVPSLSRLHLSSANPSHTAELVSSWSEILTKDGQDEIIKAENDTFKLEKQTTWHMSDMTKALPQIVQDILPGGDSGNTSNHNATPDPVPAEAEHAATNDEGIVDYDAIIKRLVLHEDSIPEPKETPYFNHSAYFSSLLFYTDLFRLPSTSSFGTHLLYGEVVTSTNTLLEKNSKLLNLLPQGLTATATTQLAGRGRGNNVWVSPPGSLMFSTVIRHPLALSNSAPVVFIQYLAALAIVSGIQKYDRGHSYQSLPIKLKWPNDIYALDPCSPSKSGPNAKYVKIGGILVNSSYSGGDYTLVVGVGLNVSNAAPTTSLNALATAAKLPPFMLERLLASILTQFEVLHIRFLAGGFSASLLEDYYKHWLHSDQIVTLEAEGGVRAQIKGIARDWGLLVAEELGWEDRPTGKTWELQSDSNSFDFFRGLVRRKT